MGKRIAMLSFTLDNWLIFEKFCFVPDIQLHLLTGDCLNKAGLGMINLLLLSIEVL